MTIDICQESKTNDNNHLLVKCETSPQKELKPIIINSFKKFESLFGYDCSKIIQEIERHGLYITNGQLYFLYNSRLNFFQKFRSKKEDVLKLGLFYDSFDKTRTSFWTITKKKLFLETPLFKPNSRNTKIEFEEINRTELNLRQLFYRLEKYGYHITKYILVPEIKESDGSFNYHYHGIFEAYADISKIRSNPKKRFRELVYNPKYKRDMENGWISYPILSSIWKEITKDDSYRIKREKIRSQGGVFHYILSYMNKGIEYTNYDAIPYLYFAMKSKKAYRIKGLKKMPKIKYTVLTKHRNKVVFNPLFISWLQREEIPIEEQEYYLQLFRDDRIVEERHIIDYFNPEKKRQIQDNQLLSNFDNKLLKNRLLFTKKYNWEEVERTFNPKERQKLLSEGYIYDTNEGYKIL